MKRKPCVMVCVTRQKTCERLIHFGAGIAKEEGFSLVVAHVVKTGVNFLEDSSDGEALEYLFEISKQFGADMSVLRADDAVDALAKQAKKLKAAHMVMGRSPSTEQNRIHEALKKQLKSAKFHIIDP